MTAGPGKKGRKDRAVIMARGQSSRMGSPKGLIRLSANGPPFVRKIADLYLAAGLPVDVVTGPDNAAAYGRELPAVDSLRVLAADPGFDTALTLLTVWRSCRAAGIAVTHVWAHPVDLPLVDAETVGRLMKVSRREPDRVIRPQWRGTPGHPVILPAGVLAILDRRESWQEGPVRDFLAHAHGQGLLAEPLAVELRDPGIVQDFDKPEDLYPDRPGTREKGAP